MRREDNSALPDEMVPLGAYEWPTGPTRRTFKHLAGRFLDQFRSETAPEEVAPSDLRDFEPGLPAPQTLTMLRRHHHRLLDACYLSWARDPERRSENCIVLTRPSMPADLLPDWAEAHGFARLGPPAEIASDTAPDLSGDGLIVIDDLGRWFRRETDGLCAVRALIAAIARTERKILCVASGWTHAFLRQAAGADLVLSDARTFPAFGPEAMAETIRRALDDAAIAREIRAARSGDPILACTDEGTPKDPYIRNLVEEALGCPWMALEILSRSLSERPAEDEAESVKAEHAAALWALPPAGMELPERYLTDTALVLHAVLIHNTLTPEDLLRVLPHAPPPALVPALLSRRILALRGGRLSVALNVYPAVRRHLDTRGFPLDEL